MKLELRPWKHEDASAVALLAGNPKIEENLRDGFPVPYSQADAAAYLASCLEKGEESQLCRAALADGEVAGSIGIFCMENVYRKTAELGYWFGEPYWGKGVATFAIGEICREAFARFDIVRIFAEPCAYNQGSRRALEKNGFVLEGILRDNVYKHGRVLDSCVYALLRGAAAL